MIFNVSKSLIRIPDKKYVEAVRKASADCELGDTHNLFLSYNLNIRHIKDFAKLINCDFAEIR